MNANPFSYQLDCNLKRVADFDPDAMYAKRPRNESAASNSSDTAVLHVNPIRMPVVQLAPPNDMLYAECINFIKFSANYHDIEVKNIIGRAIAEDKYHVFELLEQNNILQYANLSVGEFADFCVLAATKCTDDFLMFKEFITIMIDFMCQYKSELYMELLKMFVRVDMISRYARKAVISSMIRLVKTPHYKAIVLEIVRCITQHDDCAVKVAALFNRFQVSADGGVHIKKSKHITNVQTMFYAALESANVPVCEELYRHHGFHFYFQFDYERIYPNEPNIFLAKMYDAIYAAFDSGIRRRPTSSEGKPADYISHGNINDRQFVLHELKREAALSGVQ